MAQIKKIDLDRIIPGPNFRGNMGDVDGLAQSIKESGLLHPIRVRKKEFGAYEIVTGHRRYQAHKVLGRETIDAIIVESEDDQSAVERLVENLQREDLQPIDIARGVQLLVQHYGMDDNAIGRSIGKSQNVVRQWRMLARLPDHTLKRISIGSGSTQQVEGLAPRHLARVLPRIPDIEQDPSEETAKEHHRVVEIIDEFIEKGGESNINAHQSDAAWRLILDETASVEEAIEQVDRNREAYKYSRKDVDLPPPIEDVEALEEDTLQQYSSFFTSLRSWLYRIKPDILALFSHRNRDRLAREWSEIEARVSSIGEILRANKPEQVEPRKLESHHK